MAYAPPSSPAPCCLNSIPHFRNRAPPYSSFSFFASLRVLPATRVNQLRRNDRTPRNRNVICGAVKAKESSSLTAETVFKEPHKYFDQVIITVRSGDGGHGAILTTPSEKPTPKTQGKHHTPSEKPTPKTQGKHHTASEKPTPKTQGKHHGNEKSRRKGSYKRDSDGSLILPVGGHGGDVVIYVDASMDSLLEFHRRGRYNAKRGGNVNAMGVFTPQISDGISAPTLRIPVPLGTVVKRKRGKLLADLANPGDEVLVARGGQGGISLLEMPEHKKKKILSLTSNVVRDDSDGVFVLGQPGEEFSLELILRVVADVGLVGLPNAGKSTLLAAITFAKPDIADYPFTTLMPNLGRLDGDPSLGAGMYSSEATLADLPGLIEGAHLGKGLGRNFLRHLRRTRMLVHVVDSAAEDPVKDYRTVKEELRMYNPDYLERPYIVVLNKIDMPEAMDRLPYLTQEISQIGRSNVPAQLKESSDNSPLMSVEQDNMLPSELPNDDRRDKEIGDYPQPLAVVGVSVLKGIRVNEMLKEIRAALRNCLITSHASSMSKQTEKLVHT